MLNWVKRIIFVLLGVLAFGVVLGWLVLSSSLFSGTRSDLTAKLLTRALDREVLVTGDARIVPGLTLEVEADGLSMPSSSMPDVALANIGRISFDVSLMNLLNKRPALSNLIVDSASLTLIVAENGVTSWDTAGEAKPPKSASGTPKKKMQSPLSDHRLALHKTTVIYQDARNGLDLTLQLADLDLSRKTAASALSLAGTGTLNGQSLTLDGTLPPQDPFSVAVTFDQIKLALNGTPATDGYGAGMSVDMSADVTNLGQLLDVLKLEKSVDGTGHVSAVFTASDGVNRITDLKVLATLTGGQSVEVAGDIGELGNPEDMSIDTMIRLYPEDTKPAPTNSRRDLKLISVYMEIHSTPGQLAQRKMVIETNGFVLDTAGVGPPPIAVSKISRTPDGKLRLGSLALRIGPPASPFLILDGTVEDSLRLDGVAAAGQLDLTAGSLIAPLYFQGNDSLGRLTGDFHLAGNLEKLQLTDLNASTQGTDLWDLKVQGSVGNILKAESIALDIAVDVASGGDLLEAMNLKRVEAGPVSLSASMSSHDTNWTARAGVAVADSELHFDIELDDATTNPKVEGKIVSDLIRVDHLKDIVAAAVQLGRLNELEKAAAENVATQTDITAEAGTDTPAAPPIRDLTLLPIGRAILLSGVDLGLTIDLNKIEGKKGISSLHSGLEMQGRKMQFGPMKVEYGDTHFDISGAMDLLEYPELIKLSGSTGGWDFANILHSLNVKKQASGILSATFDVSGNITSVQDFLTSMNGYATISMHTGSIDTQLLDIAGLGVLPWLFSKERGAQAPIVCMLAPLSLSNGRISTKKTVLETDQVQIVVYGNADLKAKSLDISGQPRKIGKPLSRSPWPFTLKGPMAKPKVKVKDGPRRVKRSDGADTMPAKRKRCVPDILQLQ